MPAADSTPNVCSPQSFSPISSARHSAPPNSATSGGTTARQPRPHRPPRTPAVPRPRSQHRRGRIRRDVHQPQRGARLRGGDRRRRPPARHRGAGRHPRRRGRGARCRHRRYGRPHRRARRRTRGTERGAGVLDGARDRHRVAPRVHRARRTRPKGRARALAGVRAGRNESARRSWRTPGPCCRRSCAGSPTVSRR